MKKHTMVTKTIQTIIMSVGLLTAHGLFTADNTAIEAKQFVNNQYSEIGYDTNETNSKTSEQVETITEQFVITSVENGIIRGELVNGNGEGIYFDLMEYKEELKEYDALWDLAVNDLISIEWTVDNYDNGDWMEMERVTYNKQGNKEGVSE